jgi:hypothetical protein
VTVAIEAKPFASLSSGLLARKGAARPAMKPQGFGQMGGGSLEDLGWNDMGFEPPKPTEVARDSTHDAFGEDVDEHPRVHPTGLTPAHPTGLTPVQSPVHSQQAEIAGRLGVEDEEVDETAEPFEPEAERHLKLRLACAVNGRSAQQLVTDALDQLLDGMPELEGMAQKAKRKG